MKKLLLLVVFLVPSFAFASFDADMKYGSKGDDVVALQEFLVDQGVFTGASTGNFYALTLAAVKKFQKLEGITPVSGYVGPVTRGVINKILSDAAPDSEGDATVTQTPVDLSTTAPSAPVVTSVAPVAPPVQVVSNAPRVDLKVNNSDGPVASAASSCIFSFVPTCTVVSLTWDASNVHSLAGSSYPSCGVTGGSDWVGNPGSYSGTRTMTLKHSSLTYNRDRNADVFPITFECDTDAGKQADVVTVVMDASAIMSRLKALQATVDSCTSNPIPLGDQQAQCREAQNTLNMFPQ